MSDLNDRGEIPTAHGVGAEAKAPTLTSGSDLTFGVARNVAEFADITSNGKRITDAAKAVQVSVVVVQEINMPAMCRIVYDIGKPWSKKDFDQFKPGAKLKIRDGYAQDSVLAPMYVSGMTLGGSAGRLTLTVTAFDKLHFLRFGAYTKWWVGRSDEYIFTSVTSSVEDLTLSPAGLREGTYPYVLQDNETSYDFLVSRCRQANYECMVRLVGGKETLIVRSSEQGRDPSLTLAYKNDVEAINLDMRVPTLGSVVTARGYDVSSGDSEMGAFNENSVRDKMKGAETGFEAAGAFGASPMTLRRPDLNDGSSLDHVAAAERAHHQDVFIECSATLRKINLQAIAGINVMFEGTNSPFDGRYYIVKSTHQFDLNDRNRNRTVLDLRRSGM